MKLNMYEIRTEIRNFQSFLANSVFLEEPLDVFAEKRGFPESEIIFGKNNNYFLNYFFSEGKLVMAEESTLLELFKSFFDLELKEHFLSNNTSEDIIFDFSQIEVKKLQEILNFFQQNKTWEEVIRETLSETEVAHIEFLKLDFGWFFRQLNDNEKGHLDLTGYYDSTNTSTCYNTSSHFSRCFLSILYIKYLLNTLAPKYDLIYDKLEEYTREEKNRFKKLIDESKSFFLEKINQATYAIETLASSQLYESAKKLNLINFLNLHELKDVYFNLYSDEVNNEWYFLPPIDLDIELKEGQLRYEGTMKLTEGVNIGLNKGNYYFLFDEEYYALFDPILFKEVLMKYYEKEDLSFPSTSDYAYLLSLTKSEGVKLKELKEEPTLDAPSIGEDIPIIRNLRNSDIQVIISEVHLNSSEEALLILNMKVQEWEERIPLNIPFTTIIEKDTSFINEIRKQIQIFIRKIQETNGFAYDTNNIYDKLLITILNESDAIEGSIYAVIQIID